MRYVLLRIDDDAEASQLLEDLAVYPDGDLLTPCQENRVHAVLVRDALPVLVEISRPYEHAMWLRAQWEQST